MTHHRFVGMVVAIVLVCGSAPATDAQTSDAAVIIGLERAAFDRWIQGDGSTYQALLAPDVTVFDPRLNAPLRGRDAVVVFLERIRPKTPLPGYDMLDPTVQPAGDARILTFTFVSYDETRTPTSRWNFTEVYRRTGSRWFIAHSHASFVGGQPPGIRQ